jgi:hypothetical protein
MSYVVVDLNTKCLIKNTRTGVSHYDTERAAKSARTRFSKTGYVLGDMAVMASAEYQAQVPMITVKNLMTGAMVEIRADTPWNCRVDAESYWSN